MSNRLKVFLFFGILFYTVGPALLVFVAASVATSLGCTLNEGDVSTCRLVGVDIGGLLYAMTVTGWLAIATIPTGTIALGVYVVCLLGNAVLSRSENKQSRKESIAISVVLALCVAGLVLGGHHWLREDPLNLDSFSNKQDAKFIKACSKGSPEKIKKHLAKGANPNLDSPYGMNPLLAAYIGRNFDGFIVLLENGADPNFIPHTGMDEHVAGYIMGSTLEDWLPDGIPYVKALLKHGLDPSLEYKSPRGFESLQLIHLAAGARRIEYLQMFVESGADINAESTHGPPLQIAIHEYLLGPENALYLLKQPQIEVSDETRERLDQAIQNASFAEDIRKLQRIKDALPK